MKPGYKQTGVGAIPEQWDAKPLKGRVSITHGFAFSSKYFASNGLFRLTTPGHFHEGGGFRDIGEKQKFYTGPVPSNYVLQPGDLIVAMTEQAEGLLGSAAFIPDVVGYLHNQRLGRVRTLSSKVYLDYLFWVFNSGSYRTKVRETAAGTKVKHTSPKKLLEIPVRLPPESEQRRIAEALSDVDELLGGLERLIAKKSDLKQASMQQLLTGRTRLPRFHGEWEAKGLRDFARFLSGTYLAREDYQDGEFEVQGAGSIMGKHTAANFPEPISVIGRVGTVGRPRFMPKGCWVNNNAAGVAAIPGVAVPSFVHLLLTTVDWSKVMSVTAQPFLVIEALMGVTFSLPKLAEQTAIAEVLTDMDAELSALERRRSKTRDIKQAIMQELLTGKTRLV